ncbi:MAG: hypothetical protein EOP06_02750 [Proteobacteria bacterium]|nr:MAG: hypothetical protein EOP06_02750 [Pseudomonadota bacterium]
MALSPREELASATMLATHEVIKVITRSNATFEELLRSMHDLCCLITTDGRILWGNHVASVWLGCPIDKIHEHNLLALFDEQAKAKFIEAVSSRSKGSVNAESIKQPLLEIVLKVQIDGKERSQLWSFSRFKPKHKDRRGVIVLVSASDITETLSAQSAAAKFESELETAQLIQQAFLPPTFKDLPDYTVAAFYRPADQCSGDWWGHFDLGNDCDLVCIVDVTGHGVASALVTAMTQATCMTFARRAKRHKTTGASALLDELNLVIYETFKGSIQMTCSVMVFDRKNKIVRYSSAAHPAPLLLTHSSGTLSSLDCPSDPLGYSADSKYPEKFFALKPNTTVFLYTDGLTEGRNLSEKMYGNKRLRKSLVEHAKEESLSKFLDLSIADAFTFFENAQIKDDITVVALRTK